MSQPYQEKRQRQRFIARRGDEPVFWLHYQGERIALQDLSLEGFSVVTASLLNAGQAFLFELRLEGIPDKVRGEAQAVNFLPGNPRGLSGCRFTRFDGPGVERLQEWLTSHVIASATVRITAREAEKIVEGPSLI